MFPIRDHNPSGRTPVVTYLLIVANVAVFLFCWLAIPSEAALSRFFYDYGLVPDLLTEEGVWSGLFTSMFLHGGWMHLLGNMLFLWIFGDNLEDLMGHVGFALFYLASGLGAAGLQVAADPDSLIPMVGASGAIAGVMGGYLLLFPRARVDVLVIIVIFVRIFALPAWVMLGLWFAFQLLAGVATPTDMGGVAYWAHAGGFIAGLVLALPVWIRRGGRAWWGRTHGRPPHPDATYPLSKTHIPAVRRLK